MAHAYSEENFITEIAESACNGEVSKVVENGYHESSSSKSKRSQKSLHESSRESNIIRVNADGIISKDDDASQGSHMSDENEQEEIDNKSSDSMEQEDDDKSIDNDQSNEESSTGNVLRRSERNAKNQTGIFNRLSFKYDDDFEYMGNLGPKKGSIEMDPPDSGSQGKRKRKNTALVPLPFNEGLKRTMSAKTPSSHSMIPAGENNGISYNQGRWT